MNPSGTAHAATGVIDTLLNAGVLGAVILVLLAMLAKLYMDKRADDREHASALEVKDQAHAAVVEVKDQAFLALAVKQATTSTEQTMLMSKLIDRSSK